MAPVTEVVVVKLQSGLTPTDVDAAIRKLVEGTLAAAGCNGFHTSLLHEDASVIYMLIDWVSIEAHQDFTKQDFCPGLIADAVTGCASPDVPPVVYHVGFSPASPPVLHNAVGEGRSAVAELVCVYFPAAADAPSGTIKKEVQRFLSEFAGAAPEGSSGQTAEGRAVEEIDYEGEKSRVLVIAVGWESVTAHARFRDTEGSKKVTSILRGLPGQKGIEVVHISTKS